MENHLIYYLETYTFSEIIAQATIFTVLVVVLHHFFEIFPCFHYQTVLITDAKVMYYIGIAIRANGDLPNKLSPSSSWQEAKRRKSKKKNHAGFIFFSFLETSL